MGDEPEGALLIGYLVRRSVLGIATVVWWEVRLEDILVGVSTLIRGRTSPRIHLVAVIIPLALAAEIALGQVTVMPARSAPGATEKYTVRVANRQPVALTRVELRIPRSARVISFAELPGWEMQFFTDSSGRVTAAVWTGSLAPARFVELSFLAVNANRDVQILWPVVATFSNGDRVSWPESVKSRKAGSLTRVAGPDKRSSLNLALGVMLAAVVLSIAALILSLKSDRGSRGGFQPGA